MEKESRLRNIEGKAMGEWGTQGRELSPENGMDSVFTDFQNSLNQGFLNSNQILALCEKENSYG